MTSALSSGFCHIVLPAPDLHSAQVFYENVFGWRVTPNHPGPGYWFFQSGNVGGAFDGSAQATADGIVLVLEVSDMAATLNRIVEHGGTVTRGRSKIGEASSGYDAYFLDPSGNKLGLFSEL